MLLALYLKNLYTYLNYILFHYFISQKSIVSVWCRVNFIDFHFDERSHADCWMVIFPVSNVNIFRLIGIFKRTTFNHDRMIYFIPFILSPLPPSVGMFSNVDVDYLDTIFFFLKFLFSCRYYEIFFIFQ